MLVCFLVQETWLCAFVKSVVASATCLDDAVQECARVKVQSLLLRGSVPPELVGGSQGADGENIG